MIFKSLKTYNVAASLTDDTIEIDLRLAALAEAMANNAVPDPNHMRELAALLRERAERRRMEVNR